MPFNDMNKWRRIAGLQEQEEVSQDEVLNEGEFQPGEGLVNESEKVDFSSKAASGLAKLEAAIESKGGKNVTLSDGKEGLEDLKALGLTQKARVVDMGKLVYKVFADSKGHLWFLAAGDSGSIKETSLTMDELRKFNKETNDVKMREEKQSKKETDDSSE